MAIYPSNRTSAARSLRGKEGMGGTVKPRKLERGELKTGQGFSRWISKGKERRVKGTTDCKLAENL